MLINFDKSSWDRGDYPTYYQNGTVATQVTNPWYSSENKAAPFDQGKSTLSSCCSISLTLTDDKISTSSWMWL
jgi:hypothetical protein